MKKGKLMTKYIYSHKTDNDYNQPLSIIIEFADGHGCVLTSFKRNGPAGGNHECIFSSNNFEYILELAQQLKLDESNIITDKKVLLHYCHS